MVRLPVRNPAIDGLKVTLIEQFAPAPTEPLQVLTAVKSPVALMPVTTSEAFPVLVKVTVRGALFVPSGWLPKSTVEGLKLAKGPLTPVPDRPITCGLPGAVSVNVTEPATGPGPAGEKVRSTSHAVPTVRLDPQVVVCAKLPLTAMFEISTFILPEFDTCSAACELVVPTPWPGKLIRVG